MDNKKQKIKKESGDVNHFDRLPDELLLSVMNRMADDLKSLCRCSLVSKRFASTIFSIQALSPTIPCHLRYYQMPSKEVSAVFQQILDYPTDHLTTIIRSSSIEVPKVFLFLQKFNELKSIHLQIAFPVSSSSFLKWKAKFRTSGGPIIDRFVSVLAYSVSKKIENGLNQEEEEEEFSPELKSCYIHKGSLYPLRCCRERLIVLCLLVKLQHSLQSVTVTDSGEQGILALMDEKLVEFRKSLFGRGGSTDFVVPTVQMGWLNKLHLPSSGLVMKGVHFAFFGSAPDSDSPMDCSEVVSLGYEGQERILGEVVSEIVMNHRESIVADDDDHFLRWLNIILR